MKQTAVEWLIDQWPILESQLPTWLIEKAKEMEKEQLKMFYEYGGIDALSNEKKNIDNLYNEIIKTL